MIDYQKDFYGWTQQQAFLLKAGRLNELDIVNLLEEIETMGRSEKRELDNRLTVLLVHLLKWQYQPVRRGKSWQLTIEGQRDNCFDVLEDNPSLKPQLNDIMLRAYSKARTLAAKETGLDKSMFPLNNPWTLAQLLDSEFYPD
ncbi:MAG: DUF29 domain-containing protein [Methylococcaceae bacterium]